MEKAKSKKREIVKTCHRCKGAGCYICKGTGKIRVDEKGEI